MAKNDFIAFYQQHVDSVYRFVYFRVNHNRSVAEDLTSDIFTHALEAFDRFDPTKGEKSWIMTIARNRVINHWRDKKESVDIDDIAFSFMGTDGRETAQTAEDVATLRAAMQKLNKEERALVEQKYLLGYRYKEIAQAMGKNVGTARVETHRAMKKLKALLKGKV